MWNGVVNIRQCNDPRDRVNIYLRFRWPTAEELREIIAAAAHASPSPETRSNPCAPENETPGAAHRSPSPSSARDSCDTFGSELTALPKDDASPAKIAAERGHPMNDILKALLSWFKAYYALDDPLEESTKTSPQTASPGSSQSTDDFDDMID